MKFYLFSFTEQTCECSLQATILDNKKTKNILVDLESEIPGISEIHVNHIIKIQIIKFYENKEDGQLILIGRLERVL